MPDDHSPEDEFTSAAQQVAQLSQEFETLPYPNLRDKAANLLQAIDTLHRAPLERLVALIRDANQVELLDSLSKDPMVRQLFLLYDLLPADARTQVETALGSFRDYAHAHGGDIEVQDVEDGAVSLRVSGACLACSRSTTSLSRAIEATLRREFPDFRSLEIRDLEPVAGTQPTFGPETACPPCS